MRRCKQETRTVSSGNRGAVLSTAFHLWIMWITSVVSKSGVAASLCHRTPKRARPVGSRDSFTNSVTLLPFYKRRTQQLAHRMHELWVGQGTYFGVRPGRLLSVGMLFIKRIPIHALTRIRQRSASAVHPANGASGCLRCAKSGIYVQGYKPKFTLILSSR